MSNNKVKNASVPAHILARMAGGGYISPTGGSGGGVGITKTETHTPGVYTVSVNGVAQPFKLLRYEHPDTGSKLGWILVSDEPGVFDCPRFDILAKRPDDAPEGWDRQSLVLQGSMDLAPTETEWQLLVCSYADDAQGKGLDANTRKKIATRAKKFAAKGVPYSAIPRVNLQLADYIHANVIDAPMWQALRDAASEAEEFYAQDDEYGDE